MRKLAGLAPEKVFEYFEALTQIPRGSGHMEKVSAYCMEFAENLGLKALRDAANNVIIYKDGTPGYENSEPVILQGHLDMVCQKEADREIDFLTEGLDIYVDGDLVRARGTTLGGDNGIAIAMTMAILADNSLEHPPIEAVFTTDEEIGMIGASNLDMSKLSGRRMMNLDSGEEDVVTVSCAGGIDIRFSASIEREARKGKAYKLVADGLQGGHSGSDIHKNRVNSNILVGKILQKLADCEGFDLVSISGGDKGNAIARKTEAVFLLENEGVLQSVIDAERRAVSEFEPNCNVRVTELSDGEYQVMPEALQKKLIVFLNTVQTGVLAMSNEMENLVETSANMGILGTSDDMIFGLVSLRSNKQTEMDRFSEIIQNTAKGFDFTVETTGFYPPWEFKKNSHLQEVYKQVFREVLGKEAATEAIHAGLECGVFSAGLPGLDCISIGPELHDLHVPTESFSISSTERIFKVVCGVLKALK